MRKQKFIPTLLITAILSLIYSPFISRAQKGGPGVGQWKSYLAFNEITGITTDGQTLYCGTSGGFFSYNKEDGSLNTYTKVNGLSDIGLSGVGYDNLTKSTLLAYTNSNIDIFKNGNFYNIPDLKNFSSSGDKSIHHVLTDEGLAYLSTGIGLTVINLDKNEVKESVVFYNNTLSAVVYATAVDNTNLYAATSVGLFRIAKNNPSILNYLSWTKLDNDDYTNITIAANVVYAAKSDSLFKVNDNNQIQFLEKIQYPIVHLDPGNNGLWITASDGTNKKGFGILRQDNGTRLDSFSAVQPTQILQLAGGDVWFGDMASYGAPDKKGLRKKTGVDQSDDYSPAGPITSASFDVSAYNGELWVAHGAKNTSWAPLRSRNMFSHYVNGNWENFRYVSDNENFQDFIRIMKDQNTGTVYALSYYAGLYQRTADGTVSTYTGEQYFSHFADEQGIFLTSGMALDADGNLWMSNYGGLKELSVKTVDGSWYKMQSIDGNGPLHTATDVIVDDYGQKWFLAVGNSGAVVYNDNGTISNTSDDTYRILKSGTGSGGLPDNNTASIIKDKDGSIWIGTANGIAIVDCPDEVINGQCEGVLKPFQDDQFAGYLFQNQNVQAMAVDGANRKWIGTFNGVWLLSADGQKIVYHYTAENSPLPSNNILHINLDPVTGDVYFSTEKGLIALRGTATEGNAVEDKNLFIYPNPVPTGFSGMIAIRGVAENSDVRITDISGQLVYRTKALGGQAVWNGYDYTGRKAQSGVYLVFAVNKDGTQKITGKFIIHK